MFLQFYVVTFFAMVALKAVATVTYSPCYTGYYCLGDKKQNTVTDPQTCADDCNAQSSSNVYFDIVTSGPSSGCYCASSCNSLQKLSGTDTYVIGSTACYSFSKSPTSSPAGTPTMAPTNPAVPTEPPTFQPTLAPTLKVPSSLPSASPTSAPSKVPTSVPSDIPTSAPSGTPSSQPSTSPTTSPSEVPSSRPSDLPTSLPTSSPSSKPTASPSTSPTNEPSSRPSDRPTVPPSARPSKQPSSQPTSQPSSQAQSNSNSDQKKTLAIGLGVGLGFPCLLALLAVCLILFGTGTRRRLYQVASDKKVVPTAADPDPEKGGEYQMTASAPAALGNDKDGTEVP